MTDEHTLSLIQKLYDASDKLRCSIDISTAIEIIRQHEGDYGEGTRQVGKPHDVVVSSDAFKSSPTNSSEDQITQSVHFFGNYIFNVPKRADL